MAFPRALRDRESAGVYIFPDYEGNFILRLTFVNPPDL
jgi:hypothetical protein